MNDAYEKTVERLRAISSAFEGVYGVYVDLRDRGPTPELRALGAALARSVEDFPNGPAADELRELTESALASLDPRTLGPGAAEGSARANLQDGAR